MTDAADLVITYSVTDAAIAEIAEKFKDSEADTTDGYKHVIAGIRCTRELRGEVEDRRKELKSYSLVYGRKVDKEAQRITAALLAVETPLKLLKGLVDDEKARVKREAEAKRLEVERRKLEEERAAKEAAARAEREAEEKILAEERTKLEEERKALEEEKRIAQAQTREANRIAQEKLDAEQAERQARLDQEQQERAGRLLAERKIREAEEAELTRKRLLLDQVEQERLAIARADAQQKSVAAEALRLDVERLELEKRRQAALPDADKLVAYTNALLDMKPPDLVSPTGNAVKAQIDRLLGDCQKHVTLFVQELEE